MCDQEQLFLAFVLSGLLLNKIHTVVQFEKRNILLEKVYSLLSDKVK